MMIMLAFVLGLFVGGIIGALTIACCAAGSREDERCGYDALDDEWERRNP